jgi:FMN reductase
MPTVPFIVGLGGTTRPGSTSERALQVALDRAAAQGCETLLLGGAQLPADIFDPTRSERSDAARRLVDALRRADGLLIATPAYHGGISGLVKNALDFTEDLRSDDRVYLAGPGGGLHRVCRRCAGHGQHAGSAAVHRACAAWLAHALRRHAERVGQAIRRPRPGG